MISAARFNFPRLKLVFALTRRANVYSSGRLMRRQQSIPRKVEHLIAPFFVM